MRSALSWQVAINSATLKIAFKTFARWQRQISQHTEAMEGSLYYSHAHSFARGQYCYFSCRCGIGLLLLNGWILRDNGQQSVSCDVKHTDMKFVITALIRFVVDLLYSLLYNKSSTNRISGVWAYPLIINLLQATEDLLTVWNLFRLIVRYPRFMPPPPVVGGELRRHYLF